MFSSALSCYLVVSWFLHLNLSFSFFFRNVILLFLRIKHVSNLFNFQRVIAVFVTLNNILIKVMALHTDLAENCLHGAIILSSLTVSHSILKSLFVFPLESIIQGCKTCSMIALNGNSIDTLFCNV